MIIFIESPYAGDIQRNSEYARRAMLHVIGCGFTPIAAHLLYPQVLNDAELSHRELALVMCKEIREKCDEVWFFIDYGMSPGMERAREEMQDMGHEISIGKNLGEDPSYPYRKLPLEQMLELERQDRKGAHYHLDIAERKLKEVREEVKGLQEDVARLKRELERSGKWQQAEIIGANERQRVISRQIKRLEETREELKAERERVARLEADAVRNAILHPNGRCTCWGEGWCELCRKWEAEEVWTGCFAGGTRPDTDRTVVVRLKNGEQFGAFFRKGVWHYLNGKALLLQAEVEAWREPGGEPCPS